MAGYPEVFERAIEHLRRLPGIGAKSAERIASWLIARPEEVAALADAVVALARSVRLCARCFNLSDGELCAVCRDAGREPILCVVEEVRDLMTLEKAVHDYAQKSGRKMGDVVNPLRVATTGQGIGPGLYDCLVILGRDRCRRRIAAARAILGESGSAT